MYRRVFICRNRQAKSGEFWAHFPVSRRPTSANQGRSPNAPNFVQHNETHLGTIKSVDSMTVASKGGKHIKYISHGLEGPHPELNIPKTNKPTLYKAQVPTRKQPEKIGVEWGQVLIGRRLAGPTRPQPPRGDQHRLQEAIPAGPEARWWIPRSADPGSTPTASNRLQESLTDLCIL